MAQENQALIGLISIISSPKTEAPMQKEEQVLN